MGNLLLKAKYRPFLTMLLHLAALSDYTNISSVFSFERLASTFSIFAIMDLKVSSQKNTRIQSDRPRTKLIIRSFRTFFSPSAERA